MTSKAQVQHFRASSRTTMSVEWRSGGKEEIERRFLKQENKQDKLRITQGKLKMKQGKRNTSPNYLLRKKLEIKNVLRIKLNKKPISPSSLLRREQETKKEFSFEMITI